jgi:secreted trypsin-like serine protease
MEEKHMNKQRFIPFTLFMGIAATACSSSTGEPLGKSASRIIGGNEISSDPAVVSIYRTNNKTKVVSICTGTLISPTTIVTAAHCVDPKVVTSDVTFNVFSGTSSGGTELAVAKVFAHPSYDQTKDRTVTPLDDGSTRKAIDLRNDTLSDIAVIKLATKTSIPYIPINTIGLEDAIGSEIRLIGYGESTHDGKGVNVKREVNVNIEDVVTGSDVIRVGSNETGTCHGDSGGPGLQQFDGVEKIVSVNALGVVLDIAGDRCRGGSYQIRIDKYLDFLTPFLSDRNPSDPGDPGDPDEDGGF